MEAPGEERRTKAPPLGQPACCSVQLPDSQLGVVAGLGGALFIGAATRVTWPAISPAMAI